MGIFDLFKKTKNKAVVSQRSKVTTIENNFMTLASPIIDMYSKGFLGVGFYNACSDFFNYSQDVRPNKLLTFSPKNLLPIGCAFAILAIETDFGNPDINSISAENALYCLMTHKKHTPNSYMNIPYNAAVSLLLSDKKPLHDGLMHVLRSHREYLFDMVEELKFRSGENSIRSRILKYLIPEIFDIKNRDFIIDDLPLAPRKNDILEFIDSSFFSNADANEGEVLFEELYDFCRQGVSQP